MANEDLTKLLNEMIEKLEGDSNDSSGTRGLLREITMLRNSLEKLSLEVRTEKEQVIILRERFGSLISQYQDLSKEIEELQAKDNKESDRRYQSVEKVAMMVIGAVVTYVASLLSK